MSETDRNPSVVTDRVLSEVLAERIRQDGMWGVQDFPFHHPADGDGNDLVDWEYGALAQHLKDECDMRRAVAKAGGNDTRSNALVLLEEVFEAMAETDPEKIRGELVQVAAVAVKAVEALDRAEAQRHGPGCVQGQYHAGECGGSAVLDALEAFRRGVEAAPSTFRVPVTRSYLDDLVKSAENPLAGMQSAGAPSPDGTSFVVPLVQAACPGCGHDTHSGFCRELTPNGDHDEVGECGCLDDREVRQVIRHVYAGEGRLHGICRCGNGRTDLIHQCHTCDHPYHSGTVCRELCMPTPGNVDECGCDCGVAL